MNRAAMLMMVGMTACGGGETQPPPLENMTTQDASDEKPVDAGARPDAPSQDVGTGVDASGDARDAGADASDAQADALDAGPSPAMCCSQGDDASQQAHLCNAANVDCNTDAGFCTINNVLGTLSACPVCTGPTTLPSCPNDAGDSLTCQAGQPQVIMNGADLICVCNPSQTCVYADSTHCTAECR